jgi:hypothetical protein
MVFSYTWDGVDHQAFCMDASEHVVNRAALLYQLMHISDNRGKPPKEFVQQISD